jgi:hypothetical protein
MSRLLRRPSPAMVVACLALVFALTGTSYADILNVPVNSVGTVHLKANAVVSSKVKNGSLLAVDFKPGQLPGIRGYEVVTAGPNIVNNQIANSLSMTCPTGKKAIGGGGGTGGGIVPGDGPYIVVNQPNFDGSGWLVQTIRGTPGYSALAGTLLCANVP